MRRCKIADKPWEPYGRLDLQTPLNHVELDDAAWRADRGLPLPADAAARLLNTVVDGTAYEVINRLENDRCAAEEETEELRIKVKKIAKDLEDL